MWPSMLIQIKGVPKTLSFKGLSF